MNILFLALAAGPHLYQVQTSTSCTAGVCDITGPLKLAIESCDANPPINQQRVGCRFELPAGQFSLKDTIHLYRQHEIAGKGGRFWGARTQLKSLSRRSAFVVASHKEAKASGRGWGGAGSVIRDLGLYGPVNSSTTSEPHGIELKESRVKLKGLYIRGFVHGIHIQADVRHDGTASNVFAIEDVRVDNSDHAGVFIDGADANAGLLSAVDTSVNCQHGDRWKTLYGKCANMIDSSFLGNTHIASHTAYCKDADTGSLFPGYIAEGLNQRSAFVGAYAEMDQLPGELSVNSNAMGGVAGWTGHGSYWFGRRIDGLIVVNDKDPENITEFWLGRAAAPGTVFEMRSSALARGWPLAMHASPRGWWQLRLANSDFFVPLRIWGKDNATWSLGHVEMGK